MPAVRVMAAVTVVLLGALAASPDLAQASFPGENGRFVFTQNFI